MTTASLSSLMLESIEMRTSYTTVTKRITDKNIPN